MKCSTKKADSIQNKEGGTKGEETPVNVTVDTEEDRRQEGEAGGLGHIRDRMRSAHGGREAQRLTSSQ